MSKIIKFPGSHHDDAFFGGGLTDEQANTETLYAMMQEVCDMAVCNNVDPDTVIMIISLMLQRYIDEYAKH